MLSNEDTEVTLIQGQKTMQIHGFQSDLSHKDFSTPSWGRHVPSEPGSYVTYVIISLNHNIIQPSLAFLALHQFPNYWLISR